MTVGAPRTRGFNLTCAQEPGGYCEWTYDYKDW